MTLGHYTNFVNLLDLCAIAVPAGHRPDGVPFGLTLVAPAHHDREVGALAAEFAGETPATLPLGIRDEAALTVETLAALSGDGTPGVHREEVLLVVVGAHLRGQPLEHQLIERGGRFLTATRTAPCYRLFALPTDPPKPGLVRVDDGGASVEAEVWALPVAGFGSFVAAVPSPLAIGTVHLADGSSASGFLCESVAAHAAPDITECGGWRAYLGSRAQCPEPQQVAKTLRRAQAVCATRSSASFSDGLNQPSVSRGRLLREWAAALRSCWL
jgi:allophanate hydrolase